MKKPHLISIRGSKGKGGGGSTFEADDNMFARQSAAFIDAIAEGPIKGLVYGDASILVDEVRLRNVNQKTGRVSSATNFNNFTVITKNGEATQIVDEDFFAEYPSAATTTDLSSAELLENEPQYFTISSGTYEKRETDYIKITISTTGMSAITKKGDNKGDIRETSVFFTIDFNWVDNSGVHHTRQMFDTGFQGKVSGKYAHTFGFNIEDIKRNFTVNDWSVKVTKLATSPDSTDTTEVQNAIYADTLEAAIADKLEYPFTAYVGGVIDAEAFNSVPGRGYEIDGKLISIPTNMYPLDYNGRKLTVSNASSFAVGDVISQVATVSSITASGDAENGFTATATVPAHGVAVGETFRATIATTATQDEDFYEGLFVCTATSSTQFTYTLNKPFDETLNSGAGGFKTLTSTTCTGTKTASLFSGGLVDKKVGNTLYLREVAAQDSAITGTITNQSGASTTVTASEQVFIPANYRRVKATEKPSTSEQDWDGTFYQSWCNNPAWVYNDLIINKVYGLGNYIDQTQVNKWELFQVGRYCDELVPAGVAAADLLSIHCTDDTNYIPSGSTGMHEPRFSANLVLQAKNEAFKVLSDITSIFRGMAYWLNGESYIVQDSEKDPVYQFTNGNVINGEFKYEGTANKTRTNSIVVEWNNPQDYYRARQEIVELEETLQKDDEFVKPETTRAFGCTSRGQARRLGKWKLLTNNLNTDTVTFETSLNAAFLRPGDIFQVIDQNKEGKSWGGRISTGSSTTAINVDRKPTGFGNTSVESGYAVGDYRLTLTFTDYKGILAQDTATIGGVAYVRGQEIPNIDNEEEAAQQQDDSGNLVFIQWTPFTCTETQTLSAVSNSGKTLTVASAFSAAPSQDAIFILSRAALATGKTKQEAKLYRAMSMVEKDRNIYEITGLEYNATKFDAVDKNEALLEYRQIFLPDSFKEVPAVTNIDVDPRIRAAGTGGTVNSLVVDWDPPLNDDGTAYTSLRHFEVEFSQDNLKWFRAGTNTNTEIEIQDGEVAILSGAYYFKVYTVSLSGVRSKVAESGLINIDFNRAVGPAEGSVGTETHFINFVGNISGDFTLESGKVTFSPTNLFHNDGKNEHAVNSQPQLDFTGLDHTSTTGGDEGYVYFDHSASVFKAIAFDETSGQFFPVGSNVFSTATGTLVASTSTTPRKFTGLDSTNFDGELAVGNVFKYVNGSNTRFHRVKRFTSDSELFTFQPTRDTLVNATNQAFSKPNFLVDYQNDTIMGKVTKTATNTYTLQKFGNSQGESAYDVSATNENFTFDANTDGTVTNESAFSCDFTVKRGAQAYTFASSGTAQNTFGISLQARTGFDNDSDVVISGSGQITIGDTDMDAVTSATATMRIFDRGRANLLIADKVLSFTKASQGTDGENAKIVVVTPTNNFFTRFREPTESVSSAEFIFPQEITITAQTDNTTTNGAWSTSAGTLTNIVNTHTGPSCKVTSANAVDGMTVTYTLAGADGGSSDSTTLEILDFDSDAISVILSNEAHVFGASKTGAVSNSEAAGSGTDIKVFQGAKQLDCDQVGTSGGRYKVVASGGTGLTIGGISTNGSSPTRIARVADHTGISTSTDKFEITYTITGKSGQGTAFTHTKVQTITKSKTGDDGADGTSVSISSTSSSGGTTTVTFSDGSTITVNDGAAGSQGQGVRVFYADNASGSNQSTTQGSRQFVKYVEFIGTPPTSGGSSGFVRFIGTDGSPGSDGDTEGVVPIYANNTSGSGASFTQGSRTFVNFFEYTGAKPTSIPSGLTYVKYIGDDGQDGEDGEDGQDGAEGAGTATAYFRQTGFSQPATPSASTQPPSGWNTSPPAFQSGKSIWYVLGTKAAGVTNFTWSTPQFYLGDLDFTLPGIFDNEFNWNFNNLAGSITNAGGALTNDLNFGTITITLGAATTQWSHNGTAYSPTGTTQTLTMACTHPTLGTSTVVGTWTRGSSTSDLGKITGFSIGSGSGASGSGNNTWTFGDINSDSGSADNAFGSASTAFGTKTLFVQHAASNQIIQINAKVINTNFSVKCLTPTMLPENLQIGDEIDSPQGKTKVIDMQYKEREGYWVLEDELEITNDHPILIDGEWILAEEYVGKKEYIDEPTEVVYVETENELLTVKGWTVGGKY